MFFFYLQAVIINEMHIKFIKERQQSKIKHITYINLTQWLGFILLPCM